MRWTQTLIPTQKETPADAQIISHQLLVRAGFIRQLTAGAYDFLPLGLRSLQKAMNIVREEMNKIGGAEVLLPALNPIELWQATGRDKDYGDNLMRLTDRHGRKLILGPTHEEVVTELIHAYISSYKQLPLKLYQIQTKFRDEARPRFGLLRVREFLMKDAYSFHADTDTLDSAYNDFYKAYEAIFTRCGIPYVVVEAESGPIGGSGSHEFMAACEAGEDTLLISDKGNYSANVEKAEIGARPYELSEAPKGDLHEIHTPGASSIDEICEKWSTFGGGKLKKKNVLKTLIYKAEGSQTGDSYNWIVVVRGDHEVNESKLKAKLTSIHTRQMSVALMSNDEAIKAGFAIGFVGPHALLALASAERAKTNILVDYDAAQGGFWVAGANKPDYHVTHFNWHRELAGSTPQMPMHQFNVGDIRNAIDGDPSPKADGGVLKAKRGIEIGHVFKLGTKYSVPLGATVLDEKGQTLPIIMGCYGIGIGRILIAAVESLHDDKGILWPAAIAPYSVVITPIRYDGEMKTAADALYAELNAAGIDTLLDDRDARPGSKFADADLIGIPVRLTIGDRGLKEGKIELKRRNAAEPENVATAEVIARVKAILAS